jgi:predicted O-linked N-acetylglucosamine transferase (SPINDLY family)
VDVRKELQQAIAKHQAGDFQGAARDYGRILQHAPRNADAWHLIGLLAYENKNYTDALRHISRAIELDGNQATFWSNLAATLLADERLEEAEQICQLCTERFPNAAPGWLVAGNLKKQQGNPFAAAADYRQALAHDPRNPVVLSNLGSVLMVLGELEESQSLLRQALDIQPQLMEVVCNLGVLYRNQGRAEEAEMWFRRALEINPAAAEVHMNLGNCLRQQGKLGMAIASYEQALELNPDLASVYNGIGLVMQDVGRPEEASDFFWRAVEMSHTTQSYWSNYLFSLNLCSSVTRDELFEAHCRWGDSLVRPESEPAWQCELDPVRPLRIGYLSPDFRNHAVARFIEPILMHQRKTGQKIHCYSEVIAPDSTTRRLQSLSDGWWCTCGRTDADVAARIRQDEIDILVDLAGHTANNRLPVLVYRPAPVQVSMIGYPYTTGLREVDYYVTNPWRDPEGDDAYYAERLIRLQHGPTTFLPSDLAPDVIPSPCFTCGQITLGSTHRLDKITPSTLIVWGEILQRLPDARLLVFRTQLREDTELRSSLLERMRDAGLDTQRVELAWETSGNYLEIYQSMDLLLEVMPWGSGTTAYEALWMGVPVVGLFGDRPTSRPVCALLERMGLSDLITHSSEDYVERVVELVSEPNRLARIRCQLRPEMRKTVCDAASFTDELAREFRRIWQDWCAQQRSAAMPHRV